LGSTSFSFEKKREHKIGRQEKKVEALMKHTKLVKEVNNS
jgi:hypothetical protein